MTITAQKDVTRNNKYGNNKKQVLITKELISGYYHHKIYCKIRLTVSSCFLNILISLRTVFAVDA
jgi:hypothetical protein